MTQRDNYYVYIVASRSHNAIYIGFTNDLDRRIYEHRHRTADGHTAAYHIHRLVYFEHYSRRDDGIAREKQLKGWRRSKKVALIERENPAWNDLSADWDIEYPTWMTKRS
jgi:putative endonuclease